MAGALAYGAPELRQLGRRYMLSGVVIAAGWHMSVVGLYYAFGAGAGGGDLVVRLPRYGGPPPVLEAVSIPGILPPRPAVGPGISSPAARPVPVPDAQAEPGRTMATQEELRTLVEPPTELPGGGSGGAPGDIGVEIPAEEQPPPEVVPCDRFPEVVKRVVPSYPELALKAGITGRVWVKVWVDREGNVKRAVLAGEGNELFNDAALEAARGFVFTPGLMNGNPVAVWVSIPFTFKLR